MYKRQDVNISVRKPGDEYGTRCEIKNLNSIKFIKQAINYEAKRQIEILESGGSIEQNTMLFNTSTGKTRPMRNKEEAHDYRYFPDPDLLPLEISKEEIGKIKSSIPELPDELKNKFIETYRLSNYDVLLYTHIILQRYTHIMLQRVAKDLKISIPTQLIKEKVIYNGFQPV